jgi:hypothetical protein
VLGLSILGKVGGGFFARHRDLPNVPSIADQHILAITTPAERVVEWLGEVFIFLYIDYGDGKLLG